MNDSLIHTNIKRLLKISFPLILISLSNTLVLSVNKIILARFSLENMNASVLAGNIYSVFYAGCISLAAVVGVMVGQYNGAQKYERISVPVWQMIWISLALFALSIPIGLFTGVFFYLKSSYI